MRFRANRLRCVVLVQTASLCLFLFAKPAAGQQLAAGVVGQVTDENGGVLPGVTVTATSPALQVPSVIDVTDERGEYRLTPLPIGTYTVEYSLPGFQSLRHEGLRLEIGLQAKLDKVLRVGSLTESIIVSGASPVVDVTATSTSTQFTRETLDLTPTSRNGIISLGAQAPGVRGRIDIGGGTVGDPPEFKAFGQKWGEYISAEGVETSHPGAGSTAGNYFNYDAIDEAKVQSLSNGPEVASYGVAISMIVKSGGNAFHGGGALAYTGKRLQSDNIDDALRAQGVTSGNPLVDRTDRGGDLGGRILRDKLWFYGAGRFREQHRLQLGGFKPDGTQVQGYVSELTENHKLSYQLNQSNKFVYFNHWSRKQTKADNVSEFVAWESQGDRTHPGLLSQSWKVEWQGTQGSSLVTSFLFGRWAWSQSSGNHPLRHNKALKAMGIPHGLEAFLLDDEDHGGGRPAARDIGTQKVWGSATSGSSLQDTGKHYAKGTLNWYRPDFFAGNHEFKAGFDYSPLWSINGTPNRGAAGDYQLVFNNGAPTQIDLFNSPVTPETDVSYLGIFVNDTWTIARRLTLNLGARYERDNPVIPAQCRLAGSWPFSPAACTDKVQFNIWKSVAPRIYFSYDVTGRAKTVIKGGWGRFDAQRIYDLLGHANPIRSYTSTYRWRDLNNDKEYDPGEVNLDPNGSDFLSSNVPATGEPNPNEKRPGTDQFSLSLERELAQNFAVRLTGVYIRTFNENRFLNTKRPPETYNIPVTNPDPGPDNLRGTADDPGTFLTYWEYPAELAGRANEYFIISNDPDAGEKHTALDIQVIKRISNRWQFLAGYTVTRNDTQFPPTNFTRNIPQWNPNVEINAGDHTVEHVAKVSGHVTLPGDVSASANYNYQTGAPQARQVLVTGGRQIPNMVINAEPLGSFYLPATNVLDIRFQKTFSRAGIRVTPRVNAYNVLNSNIVTAWNLRAGSTFLKPSAILPPRIVEFGVGITF